MLLNHWYTNILIERRNKPIRENFLLLHRMRVRLCISMDKRWGKTGKVTYGQLSQAPTALRFTRRQTEDIIAFREMKRDALILLPVMRDNALVGEPHQALGYKTPHEYKQEWSNTHSQPDGD